MWNSHIFQIFLLYFLNLSNGQGIRPAVRVRLNRQVFDQASAIVGGLVEYEVPRVSIPPTRQCFTEGCVEAHSFRMTSFRQPSTVAFEPFYPNQFRIRVTDFDFVVTGHLTGSIQVILNIPIHGTIVVVGRNIAVTAQLDLQKTVRDQPYLRFVRCGIEGGLVTARIENMGLLTDAVNNKFGALLSTQSRQQLEEAICENMNRLTQLHFSTRLSRIPRSISAKELIDILISNNIDTSHIHTNRVKKAISEDYYDEVQKTEPSTDSDFPEPTVNYQNIKLTRKDILNFFNIDRLAHILVDMTLMDAASTSSEFSLGIAGNVYSVRSEGSSPYSVPHPFRIPSNQKRKMVEVVVSEYTINSLLYQAHRTNSLLFHIDSSTHIVGPLLKTTCSADEIGQMYPNRRLELIVRSTKAPVMTLANDLATLGMEGRCIFFLEGTRQKIGVIPFSAIVASSVKSVGKMLYVKTKIQKLEFGRDVELVGLGAQDLDGLRRITKSSLERFINSATANGVPLSTASIKSPLRLYNPQIEILQKAILLQADVDLYKSLYH